MIDIAMTVTGDLDFNFAIVHIYTNVNGLVPDYTSLAKEWLFFTHSKKRVHFIYHFYHS